MSINEWISVNDNLPENNKWVIVYDAELLCSWPAYYKNGNWVIADKLKLKMITHWFPLPVPPEDECAP